MTGPARVISRAAAKVPEQSERGTLPNILATESARVNEAADLLVMLILKCCKSTNHICRKPASESPTQPGNPLQNRQEKIEPATDPQLVKLSLIHI